MLDLFAQADRPPQYSINVSGGLILFGILVYLILAALMVVSAWKIFQKAGKPGWASIVPLYSGWIAFEIGDMPGWWSLIPFVNLVVGIMAVFETARRFGKGTGFGFLMLFVPIAAYPVLAFGDAHYAGAPGDSMRQ